ncbi:MAG: hypothetical protein Q8P41_31155 [Pseudomonadota bacterium]|nr:hypothetical protein [Pseudomonadota bacterium]
MHSTYRLLALVATTTSLATLSGCIPAETGIDHTILTGTISIPPAAIEDGRNNNDVTTPQALGTDDSKSLTYRAVVVTGKVNDWTAGIDGGYGDPDHYVFTPIADGTFTFDLSFVTSPAPTVEPDPDTADTAAGPVQTVDADVFVVQLIDPATYDAETGAGVLAEGNTDGSGGVFSLSYDVTAATDYVLLVAGATTDDADEALPYTLVVSGSAPNDATILVGAYPGADPQVAENPAGGTTASDWTYDAATYTWSGTWRMMWLKTVTPPTVDENLEDEFEPTSSVEEGPAVVYLRAGTLSALNASPAAGALYTTVSVESGATGVETAVEAPLVLDGVFPKVIGQQVTETLPDTTLAEIDPADYTLVMDTLVAQEIGMLTGLGYVDIVSGSAVLDPAMSGWNGTNDSDAFAFTVPETMYVRMSAGWADPEADIDFGIWYADPEYGVLDLFSSFGDSYCLTGANPEVCESVVTLEPDVTYYLLALGYVGTDEQPYTVELEWVAP